MRRYISTRGSGDPGSFRKAVARGLAPDGGLYVPETYPDLSGRLEGWRDLPYAELCKAFIGHFADDLDPGVIERVVDRAYARFDDPRVAPLRELGGGVRILELYHGPTLAFKDFALQVLGGLYEEQIRETGWPIHVLGATSGDTGAAAISGLSGKRGVHTFILYPFGRISELQERQMTCTGDPSVFPLAIDGSFDDAQAALKALFGEADFKDAVGLSAVNSINLARILAQCVYYLHAWLRLPAGEREESVFIVPTGNFGNVLAGWMLRKMGIPLPKLRVATNRNDILYRLFRGGNYAVGAVVPSLAPAMDIQVASNFERYLYYALDEDPARVGAVMREFRQTGKVDLRAIRIEGFDAVRSDDADIRRLIGQVYRKYDMIVDPHTACAFKDLEPGGPAVVVATAHPAKFPDTIEAVIGRHPTHPRLEALKGREPIRYRVDPDPGAIRAFIEEHRVTV